MKKRMKSRKVLCLLIVLIMIVSVLMPADAMADYILEIRMDTEQDQNKTILSDLRLTELEAPQAGLPFPTQATVVSAEGVTWKVAVLWTDENGVPVSGTAGEGLYCPVIIFFVPSEYTVRGNDGNPGSFRLSIDDSVLALFGTNSLFSIFDADRSITYILNGKTNISEVRQEERIIPSQSVAGMPEEYQTPEDSYHNQNNTDYAGGENHVETVQIPVPGESMPADGDKKEVVAPGERITADGGGKEEAARGESKLTDEEKKDGIIFEAQELAEVMEDAVPEEGTEDPGQDEDPDEDENFDQEGDPAALEEDLDDPDMQANEDWYET